jgi:superfamily II DNA or RNA helicase
MSSTPALREWQQAALLAIAEEWETPGSKVLVAACPASGKTLCASAAIKQALSDERVELGIIVVPTVNVKEQWRERLEALGIDAHASASNEAMRFRRDHDEHITGGWTVICVTYAQLAQDAELFAEIARRHPVCLVADEVHHADDKESFGRALTLVAENAKLRLALSGTPFNTTGGSLAMCDTETSQDDDGRIIIKALPTYSYSYGNALKASDKPCRPVEFIKVFGKGVTRYRTIATREEWAKVVDLARENKTDTLGALLDTDSDFVEEMMQQALNEFAKIRKQDKRAMLLVVGRDTDHSRKLAVRLSQICEARKLGYSLQEIYNDTPKAHKRINQLQGDHTDIVVSVRMISEGVDIPRLRVGLYLTDYLTRMFFNQFVGRFTRSESRLKDDQYSVVIIPAHIILLKFAREIEAMVNASYINGDGEGAGAAERKNERIGSEAKPTGVGVIGLKDEFDTVEPAEAWFAAHPSSRGIIPPSIATRLAVDEGLSHAQTQAPVETHWGSKNDSIVGKIARMLEREGTPNAYSHVNREANKAVGIKRKDAMTPKDVLMKRHAYLKRWHAAIAGLDSYE